MRAEVLDLIFFVIAFFDFSRILFIDPGYVDLIDALATSSTILALFLPRHLRTKQNSLSVELTLTALLLSTILICASLLTGLFRLEWSGILLPLTQSCLRELVLAL